LIVAFLIRFSFDNDENERFKGTFVMDKEIDKKFDCRNFASMIEVRDVVTCRRAWLKKLVNKHENRMGHKKSLNEAFRLFISERTSRICHPEELTSILALDRHAVRRTILFKVPNDEHTLLQNDLPILHHDFSINFNGRIGQRKSP